MIFSPTYLTISALSLLIIPLALIAMRCNFRHWRLMRTKSVIVARSSELAEVSDVHWPLTASRDSRWERPFDEIGRQVMTPIKCGAYARAARQRERWNRYCAEAVVVISAAALGVQIPKLFENFGQLMANPEPPDNSLAFTLPFIVPLLPIFGLFAGLLWRQQGEVWREVELAYFRGSKDADSPFERRELEPQEPAGSDDQNLQGTLSHRLIRTGRARRRLLLAMGVGLVTAEAAMRTISLMGKAGSRRGRNS